MSATENKYHYIFVHGLSGWGSYDKAYRAVPYWGMFGGDHMSLQGGMTVRNDIRPFYGDLIRMIDKLY